MYYKDLILKPLFLQEFHATPTGRHARVVKIFSRLNVNVFWNEMRKEVHYIVSTRGKEIRLELSPTRAATRQTQPEPNLQVFHWILFNSG